VLGVNKRLPATPTKQDLATVSGVLFKISQEHPYPFHMDVRAGVGRGDWDGT